MSAATRGGNVRGTVTFTRLSSLPVQEDSNESRWSGPSGCPLRVDSSADRCASAGSHHWKRLGAGQRRVGCGAARRDRRSFQSGTHRESANGCHRWRWPIQHRGSAARHVHGHLRARGVQHRAAGGGHAQRRVCRDGERRLAGRVAGGNHHGDRGDSTRRYAERPAADGDLRRAARGAAERRQGLRRRRQARPGHVGRDRCRWCGWHLHRELHLERHASWEGWRQVVVRRHDDEQRGDQRRHVVCSESGDGGGNGRGSGGNFRRERLVGPAHEPGAQGGRQHLPVHGRHHVDGQEPAERQLHRRAARPRPGREQQGPAPL